MVDAARARKLAVNIRQIAAETLERRVKDPRLRLVTVTDARVTGDLREATIYYTVYGDETAARESAAALESARGIVRAAVGRRTGVKFTPTVTFVADVVPGRAEDIEDLLAAARAADEALREARVGARHAGDADPYREPRAAGPDPDAQEPDAQEPDAQDPDAQEPDAQNPDAQDPDAQGPNGRDLAAPDGERRADVWGEGPLGDGTDRG